MPPRGPQRCKYELTYTFVKPDDPSSAVEYPVKIETDSNDTKQHKDAAYRQLARMLGGSVADVQREWDSPSVGVAFANAPWSDWDDLENVLESLPGVQSIRYDPPRVQDWHPSRYILTVEGGRGDAVRMAVEQYYAGLVPVVKNGRTVVVVTSPLA